MACDLRESVLPFWVREVVDEENRRAATAVVPYSARGSARKLVALDGVEPAFLRHAEASSSRS